MFAVLGSTGQVGSVVVETLLAQGRAVRAVVRDFAKGERLADRGAEVAIADVTDKESLTEALRDVEGAFLLAPPSFAPAAGFPEARAWSKAMADALRESRPRKVVVLSTVGAHRTSGLGILEQLHILEAEIAAVDLPTTFVRAAWFMENAKWDIELARQSGELLSYLQPLDRAIPMVSVADVGRVCAENLLGNRGVVELEGPRRISPQDLANALGCVLGREVVAKAVPRDTWQAQFVAQGTLEDRAGGRIEMLDGFNSGWIDFEGHSIRGTVTLEEALRTLAQ